MIVYCCQDLIFATKIRSTADALNVVTRPVRDAAMLQARLDQVDDGKPHDPVAALIVDLEIGDKALELIDQAARHNRDITLVAFGSHVLPELLQTARDHGVHRVMTRGSFSANLPALLHDLDRSEG